MKHKAGIPFEMVVQTTINSIIHRAGYRIQVRLEVIRDRETRQCRERRERMTHMQRDRIRRIERRIEREGGSLSTSYEGRKVKATGKKNLINDEFNKDEDSSTML